MVGPDEGFSRTSTGSIGTESHTYADNGVYTVTVTVADDDASGSASFVITVANVAPVVTAAADQTADEGDLTASAWATSAMRVPTMPRGASMSTGATAVPSSAQPMPPARAAWAAPATPTLTTASYSVTVTVTDKDGDDRSDTFDVIVANVAPDHQPAVAPTNVDEGAT